MHVLDSLKVIDHQFSVQLALDLKGSFELRIGFPARDGGQFDEVKPIDAWTAENWYEGQKIRTE